MKINLYILFVLSFSLSLHAQKVIERAPLNPDYIEYLENIKQFPEKKSKTDRAFGYIPSPLNFHFDESLVEEDSKKNAADLPVKYDLRDFNLVTDYGIGRDSVKDQGPIGACWTFSTIAAIESNWMKLGKAYTDLSEQNMATCHGFNAGMDDGGNDIFALAYLTRLAGPVTEESHPYDPAPLAVCKKTGLVIPAYVQTSFAIPKNTDMVKKAIMDYGAISASIRMGNYNNYINKRNHTYCYPGKEAVDHTVLIIGWNDNLTVTGNPSYSPPSSKGAWIAKNSWGTSFADNGYFYVGYKDSKILSTAICFPERAELDEIDTLYMYDELGAVTSFGFRQETGFGLVKYHAPEKNYIKKVGTFLSSYSSYVDIEIYSEFQGDSILNGLIAASYNNHRQFAGYHTFDIPALVEGDFYVKVKYTSPGYNYPIPAEVIVEPVATPVIEEAGKFWISDDGEEWEALGRNIRNLDADLSIRVYADRNTDFQAFFTSDKSMVCAGSSIVFTDESLGDIDTYEWDFGEGAVPATTTGKGPHEVFWTNSGVKSISLKITDNQNNSKTITKVNNIKVVDNLNIILPFPEKSLVKRKSFTMYAAGAENYQWSPAEGLSSVTGPVVEVSPLENTTYTVTGTSGNCSGSASFSVKILPNPANDDVCNARQLRIAGYQGPFSNINATVEEGEPSPPEGDCNTPLEWCKEGGLQNSVWFWFTGPQTGIISINTSGMDNQIALYEADHCDSIFSPTGHKLIAANDDYYGEDKLYAAALESVEVKPDQKYFLQVDGSGGGSEGYFTITMSPYPLSADDKLPEISGNKNEITVYPLPASGILNIKFNETQKKNVSIKLYNLTGTNILSEIKNMNGTTDTSVDITDIFPGIYILEIINDQGINRQSLIIQ